jgi:Lrp/AsnC family leucine-responsive transcriptional regulator
VIDDIDIKLLEILQLQGRTHRSALAEAVKLSLPSVSDRLRKLEESGYIRAYAAVLDPKKLGKDITAFIEVTVDSSKHFPSFVEHATQNEDVLECHAITGKGSHLLKIRVENTSALERLLGKIQSWPGVSGTQTHLVLSSPVERTQIKISRNKT